MPRVPSGCQSQATSSSENGIWPSTSNPMVCSMRRGSVNGSVTTCDDPAAPGKPATVASGRQPRSSSSARTAAACRAASGGGSASPAGGTGAVATSTTAKPR